MTSFNYTKNSNKLQPLAVDSETPQNQESTAVVVFQGAPLHVLRETNTDLIETLAHPPPKNPALQPL